ncbi:DUF4231 domain-containing protein [Kribbella sp. CA-247076]|uniref:DUF4231 domain-containing protein n=1 Tax=Kribbella sp. CA-247076 TaxID=3239941 RepID=UPI003D8D23A4
MAIPDSNMPQLFRAADTASLAGQKEYLRLTRARLLLVVGAALCGVISWRVGAGDIDVLGLIALLLFIAALLLELLLWTRHPERDWYDGRAVAESVKTLAWKFAAGGEPFPLSMSTAEAEGALLNLLKELRNDYPQLNFRPISGSNLSPWMRNVRSSDLDDRRRMYMADRVRDQQNWYQKKHDENRRWATRWRVSLITLEFLGAAAALLEALTQLGVLLTPALAAAVGAIVAWLQTKQHDQVARAYGTTVVDLANALDKLEMATSEADWAREMNDTEDAISREHTLWLASRSFAG